MNDIPLHEQVILHLKKALMQGRFLPGQKLTLRALAEELGTSIAPVREAVGRLAALDALRVYPKRFILVPTLTAEKYFEFVEVRKLLEGHATVRACKKMSDEDIREVVELNKRIKAFAKQGYMDQAMEENQRFHFKIYRGANSTVLLENIEHIWLRVGPTIHQILSHKSSYVGKNHPMLVSEHTPLINALKARDSVAALKAMSFIIDHAADEILAGLRRQFDSSSETLKIITKIK